MSSDYWDRFGRAKSICHRWSSKVKLGLALLVVGIGVSIPVEYWPAQGVLAGLVFIGHSLAGIPLGYLARRLSLFLPMLLMISISLPLSQGGTAGWQIMAAILLRGTLAFITVLWLINVMPFEQLLVTLKRTWVPDLFVATLAFMYRYIFVLWDELDKMRTARRARSFRRGGIGYHWKMASQLIGMLLIRGMGRAERIHGAMCARGWDGQVRTLDGNDD